MDKRGKKKGITPMDAALRFLTVKPRTKLETELYLDKCEYGEFEVYQVVERLKELGYINDESYASDFIQSRLATKPVSRRKLREQLYAHKLPKEIVEEALRAISDETEEKNAVTVAEKYARQFASLPEPERKKRVIQRLCARGYEYSTLRGFLGELFGSCDESEYISAGDAYTANEDEEI